MLSLAGCQPIFINFLFCLNEKIRGTRSRRLELLDMYRIVLSKEMLQAQVSTFFEDYSVIKFGNLKFLTYISKTDMLQFSLLRESRWIQEKMSPISLQYFHCQCWVPIVLMLLATTQLWLLNTLLGSTILLFFTALVW